MKQLLNGKVLDMLTVPSGVVAAVLTDITEDDKLVVEYRLISAETGEVQRVSKNVFMLAKFGPNHKVAEMQIKNHLTCKSAILDNGKTLISEDDGSAKLLNAEGIEEWVGKIKYKDEAPTALCYDGKNVWAAFTDNDTLVRLDANSLTEELRIGGKSGDNNFRGPDGIFAENEFIYVCNKISQTVWKINTKNFSAEEYLKIETPIFGFARIAENCIFWLSDGIYQI